MTPARWRLAALVAVALVLGPGGSCTMATARWCRPRRAHRHRRDSPPRARAGVDDLCVVPAALPQRTPFRGARRRQPVQRTAASAVAARGASSCRRRRWPASRPTPRRPLPYRFYGVYNEPGKPAMVFLGLGGALLHARAGDTLEGGFRLEAIGRRELSFVHLQQNVTLRMPIDGDPS